MSGEAWRNVRRNKNTDLKLRFVILSMGKGYGDRISCSHYRFSPHFFLLQNIYFIKDLGKIMTNRKQLRIPKKDFMTSLKVLF
jgi:hypothetical protein